jgi:hypothetical protein
MEPGVEPMNAKPYRLPEAQKLEVRNQVEELRKGGIITESNSPWNCPLLIVPKKDDATGEKRWRLVTDYRKVNEKTVGDAYPLPDVTEILDQLGQSKYFSCIDMVMGYHQIEVAELDRAKTAFSTKVLGIQASPLRINDGPTYVPAHDECCAKRVNWIAMFCVS